MCQENSVVSLEKFIKYQKVIKENGREEWTLILELGGSRICLEEGGDIVIEPKRALIVKNKLSFWNCEDDFIEEAIKRKEESEESFSTFIERVSMESEIMDRCSYIEEMG